ncbi:unnamed protein product, partial [Vitis vinifera]
MATPISTIFLLKFLLYSALLSSKRGLAFQGRKTALSTPSTLHNVHITSLMPSSVCSPSPKGDDKRASLEVIHKHGPCSKLSQDKGRSPSRTQMLDQDESRVNSIRSRLAKNPADGGKLKGSKVTLPSKSGSTIGTGNYVVTVGLGTPKRDLTFIFDTGSDLTWTQCEPCARYCYHQQEPIFNPSKSTSYTNISCSSPTCDELKSGTGNSPSCSASTCVYGIQYGDQSYSVGFFAQDKLALTSTDVFNNFLFGCGQNNRGLFVGVAGLIGLGRNALSLMSKYPKAAPASILDTCYDFSQYDTVDVPKINLYFSDGAEMDLDPSGIFYILNISQVCLAFAGNSDATDIAILGNVQQKTFDVVYDVAGGRIGFAPGGCE